MTAELSTDRLTLRGWRNADFDPLARFLADDDLNRYRGPGRGVSRDEAWAALLEFAGQWPLRGYGIFAVEEKSQGKLIGWAGLWHPANLSEPEMAWSLFGEAQGKGYAAEAARRVLRWAADDMKLPPLFSFVHPNNSPSRRLAERLGARLETETVFRGQPRLLYRHVLGGEENKSKRSGSDEQRSSNPCQS